MTDQWMDTDSNDGGQQNDTNSGGGLRKQLQDALAALKTVKDENGALKAQARQTAISAVLKERGLSEKVTKLIPQDVEPTAESVAKWLEEYGDIFSAAPAKVEAGSEGGDTDAGGESVVDADDAMAYIQAMRQMGNINGGAVAPAKAKDLLAKLNDPSLKHEDLLKLIESHGGGVGVG